MIDSRDLLVDLLKDKYEHEYNRKKYFDDTLGLPITLLTAFVGGIYLVINDSTKDISNAYKNIWIFLLIFLIVSCVISFYFLYRVYIKFGSSFSSFPSSYEVSKFYNELKSFHFNKNKSDDQKLEMCIESEMKNQIIKWYIDANTLNLNINENRATSYRRARNFLGISLIIGILVFLFISVTKLSHMSKQVNKPVQTSKPAQTKSTPPPAPQVRTDKYSADSSRIKKA